MPALIMIARSELRLRWASLLVIGLLAGLAGGTVVSAATLARRTATADERLAAAAQADDVRAIVVGGSPNATQAIGREILDAPGVARGRVALGAVGRLAGPGVTYVSVMAGPAHWGTDVLSPVLAAGRLPDPDDPSEVVVNESRALGAPDGPLRIGTRLRLNFLTAKEFSSFDATAPLVGRGGRQDLTIVGLVRFPGTAEDLPPLVGSPALARAHPGSIGVIGAALVQLRPGADPTAYAERVNRLGTDVVRPSFLSQFPPVSVRSTAAQARSATDTTTRVLATGLLILAVTAAVVGLAAVAQASTRHHQGTIVAQRIEAAIGVTAGQRALARLLASGPAIFCSVLVTAGAGFASAGLVPPGALRTVEPNPGWSPNLALIALIALGTGVVAATTIAAGAARALRRREVRPFSDGPLVARVTGLGAPTALIMGLRLALDRPTGRANIGGRAAIATLAVGLSIVVGTLTYSNSLHRLVGTPVRYGYPTDVVVSDATKSMVDHYATDDRFSTVLDARSADVLIDGTAASGTSLHAVVGRVEWELARGRPPRSTEEVVLGTRLAKEIHRDVGDVVVLRSSSGRRHTLTVVGVGVVPNFGNGTLGRSVALTPAGLQRSASATAFGELGLTVGPGVDRSAVLAELAQRYEVAQTTLPVDVANLEAIDRVPLVLGAFLSVLCLATLAHTVTSTVRRRRRDLAVTRALGFTARQSATGVFVMALTISATSVLVALPLGSAAGASVWRHVAEGAAVLGDAAHAWLGLLALVVLGPLLAVLLAVTPARRAARQPVTAALRSE